MLHFFEHPIVKIDFSNSDSDYYEEQRKVLRKTYEESHQVTQEVLDRWGGQAADSIKIGDLYTSNPTFPNKPIEAFELYKSFFAYEYFLILVSSFLKQNLGKWNRRSIAFGLDRHNDFIEKTEKIEPFKAFKKAYYTTEEEEYVKLRDGFYEIHLVTNLDRYAVYGEYFLFYELLKFKQFQFDEVLDKPSGFKKNLEIKVLYPKINALFHFIQFLHSNIENFNQHDERIKKLELLNVVKHKLRPRDNFKDKLKYDKLQAEIETEFKALQEETANPIKKKAAELNVCYFENERTYNWKGIESEIQQLKEGFRNEDLAKIIKHKSQYIEYRTNTHKTYLSLGFFFNELDGITKNLFDYFKETEQDEFEAFETKTIQVNSIEEAIRIFTNKDERFWLTTFFEEQEQTKHEYKSIKREIENNGCFIVKAETDTVKIYTPELGVVFTSNELSARNMETQTETKINGGEYLKTYIAEYKKGEQHFETEFKVSPNTIYGANAEQYVMDIHLNFFHVRHSGINEGWGFVKKKHPLILTHKAIKEFGYYSGIVNKVEEQVKKHPQLFATFDKCEHNLPSQPTNSETLTNSFEFENNFDNVDSPLVYDHFYGGLVKSKMLTEKEMQTFLIVAFKDLKAPKKLFALKNVDSKKIVTKVFYHYYKNVAGKRHGKQRKYAGLLGDYFQGYNTNNVSTNFSKSDY